LENDSFETAPTSNGMQFGIGELNSCLRLLERMTAPARAGATHAADIEIAVAGPMTGGPAAIGVQMKAGMTASVDALDASGALLDAKVKLVVAEAGQKLKHTRPVLRADSAGDVLV
jgi:ABC-type branched-subunit amino acid transport system substrate-binding protein